VNTVENVIKTSEFIDDIYFVREKGGRSKESIVYKERMSRGGQEGGEGSQEQSSTSIAFDIFFIQ